MAAKQVFVIIILIIAVVSLMAFFSNLPSTGRSITGRTVGLGEPVNEALAKIVGFSEDLLMEMEIEELKNLNLEEGKEYAKDLVEFLKGKGFDPSMTLAEIELYPERKQEFLILVEEFVSSSRDE